MIQKEDREFYLDMTDDLKLVTKQSEDIIRSILDKRQKKSSEIENNTNYSQEDKQIRQHLVLTNLVLQLHLISYQMQKSLEKILRDHPHLRIIVDEYHKFLLQTDEESENV